MKKISFIILALLISGEISARIFYPAQERLDAVLNILQQDPRLFWRQRPNLNVLFEGHNVKTNSRGLRADAEYKPGKQKHATRIICLGASPTFGWGVEYRDTYPYRLQQLLRQDSPDTNIEVINAGMIGYSSYQGKLFLENEILRYSPDIITVSYVINDVDRYRFFLNNGKPDNEASPFSPERIFLTKLFRKSRLYNLLEKAVLYAQSKRKNFYDRAAAVNFPRPRVSGKDYRHNLEEVIRIARENKIKLIFVKIPVNLPLPPRVGEYARQDAEKYVSSAIECIKLKQYQRASHELAKAISLDPYLPEAYFYQGVCYGSAKDYGMAEKLLKKAKMLEAYRCRVGSEKYNEIMEETAVKYVIPCADIVSEFKKHNGENLFVDPKFDPIHPNKPGHEIIAENIYRIIKNEGMIYQKG